ncbi:MAG: hypothetical protein ACFFEF_07865 [Candidatus Thorarchaeota archaeon]
MESRDIIALGRNQFSKVTLKLLKGNYRHKGTEVDIRGRNELARKANRNLEKYQDRAAVYFQRSGYIK